jgi:hypothetical protein
MKKLFVTLVISLMVFGALAAVSSASTRYEVDAFMANGDDATEARVFVVGGGTDPCTEYCNSNRSVDVSVTAHVAQWAHWDLSANGWEWYVRKPGVYYADCISAFLQSNGDVTLTLEGFDNLKWISPSSDDQSINPIVKQWFALTNAYVHPTDDDWLAPTGETEQILVPDSADLHEGIWKKVWNKIEVLNCNTAGTYVMSGTITMTLSNQQPWINPLDGNWTF